ncbi:MAG: hypothetical protein ABFD96_23300, partial [Armatimonadia bacterium]
MVAALLAVIVLGGFGAVQAAEVGACWTAPDRGAKIAELIPGRKIPKLTRENLFADWTKQQVERWSKDHAVLGAEEAYAKYAATAPTDAELRADFPRHISPFAQVRSGQAAPGKADAAFTSYCPLCGAWAFGMTMDPKNPYHATTTCCRRELWGREQDMPAGYALRPTEKVKFLHLDDTWYEAPCTVYTDKDGVVWELFIKTLFDHKRWLSEGGELVRQYAQKFAETADPLYVHKVAVLLDEVADTYYGLPLAWDNHLCMGKEGKGLSRAEWEALPRPAIFEVGELGAWGRRMPHSSPGWLNMMDEHIWVEPFGRVRHHPAFKAYSMIKYGDPEALDKKISYKLMRELALMFKGVFSQKLLTNYQEANYVDMWLLGILAEDPVLVDFAGPAQEVAMYNHTYQDGLNGEGAPNYMAMPGGYFYPFLADPKGWLQYYPKFLEDHPFYQAANAEMRKLTTVRGLQVEFGDQHEQVFPALVTKPAQLRENEKVGSRNWAGYGVGIMRIGGPGHRQELGLTYTRASLHNAQDALGLECWVDGIPMLRRGGYAAYWSNARLQWERPEVAALRQMGYPKEIVEAGRPPDNWSWNWCHSPLCQNNLTVDEKGVGAGWDDNRGYGEVVTFKGGEAAGEPGSGFQVLDVVDHYSWSRVDRKMDEFRRTVIGVEGPDGRPYAVDILKAKGEGRQALYNSVFGDAVEMELPAAKAKAETLAEVYAKDNPEAAKEDSVEQQSFRQMRKVEVLGAPAGQWGMTWKQDAGAYAPRDANGKPFARPWADDTGQVRLRMIGMPDKARTELIRGQGPWVGWLHQPLPNGQRADGYVAFRDARDIVVERRLPAEGQKAVDGRYVHILEGYREGEQSVIKSVTPLQATSVKGPEREIVA